MLSTLQGYTQSPIYLNIVYQRFQLQWHKIHSKRIILMLLGKEGRKEGRSDHIRINMPFLFMFVLCEFTQLRLHSQNPGRKEGFVIKALDWPSGGGAVFPAWLSSRLQFDLGQVTEAWIYKETLGRGCSTQLLAA